MKINKIFFFTFSLALIIGLRFGISLQRKFVIRTVGIKGVITPFISQVTKTLQAQEHNLPEGLQGNMKLFILAE